MAFRGVCPYIKEHGKDKEIDCECVNFNFPDRGARRDVIYGYCAHPEKWKDCMVVSMRLRKHWASRYLRPATRQVFVLRVFSY